MSSLERPPVIGYVYATLAVTAATVGTFIIYRSIVPSISLLFFPAVMIPALFGGYGPALFATFLSTLSLAFFFVPPRFSLSIGIDDAIRLSVFALIAVATAWVSSGRKKAEAALAEQLRHAAIREDRVRVSRDLHDGILQALTGIRLELQGIADEGENGTASRDQLLAIERALGIEQRELRLLIDALKPDSGPITVRGPFAQRMEDTCARLSAEWKIPIAVVVETRELAMSEAAQNGVHLMIHEAIVNALKHAHPSRVSVTLGCDGAFLRILVADDGRGFAFRGRVEHDQLMTSNIGPVSLRERVTAFGGRMAIESMPTGSRLEVTLPYPGNHVPAPPGAS